MSYKKRERFLLSPISDCSEPARGGQDDDELRGPM